MINQLNILTGKLTPEKLEWADGLLRCDENYLVADYSMDTQIKENTVENNWFYDIPHFPNDFTANIMELHLNLHTNKDSGKTSRVIFVNIEKCLKNGDVKHAFKRIISNPRILKTTTLFLVDDIKTVPKYIMEGFEPNVIEFKEV